MSCTPGKLAGAFTWLEIPCKHLSRDTPGVLIVGSRSTVTSGEGILLRAFEGRSSLEPDDLFLVSTRWVGAGSSRHRGSRKGRSWHQPFTHGRCLPPQFLSQESESESESTFHLTSFMFNAVSKSENGTMLSAKRQILPSRKDDRVILHFDCRYSPLTCIEQYTYNMQLADSAVQR